MAVLFWVFSLCWPAHAQLAVTVHPVPEPAVTRFDPDDPPEVVGAFAAVTVVRVNYAFTQRSTGRTAPVGGGCRAVRVLSEIDIDASPSIEIFLPQNASDRLRNHEHNHAHIATQLFEKLAELVFSVALLDLFDTRVEATAPSCRAADDAAREGVSAVVSAAADRALAELFELRRVLDTLDARTDHGTKVNDAEEAAFTEEILRKICADEDDDGVLDLVDPPDA